MSALGLLLPPDAPGPVPILTVSSRADAEAAAARAASGVVALAPRRWRSALRRLGDRPGTEAVPYLLLPHTEAPAFVVPVAPAPLRYVAAHAGSAWGARLGAALAPSLGGLLVRAAPSVAVAAYGRGAAPFGWLSEHAPATVSHAVVRPSWRRDGSAAVVGFDAAGPVAVAKVRPGARGLGREAERLAALGPAAAAAGAVVPRVLARGERAGVPVLIETPVPGVPVTALAASGRASVPDVLGRLRVWLGRWHRATQTPVRLRTEHLQAWIEAPLSRLGDDLPAEVSAHLRALAEAVADQVVPLVAAHHDLTMRNVLLDGVGTLGVVDWEEAEPHALPLTDWLYAAVDLVHAARGGTRADAARAALAPGGPHAAPVDVGVRALAGGLGLSPDAVALARHAVWLRHAANEADVVGPGAPRPFLRVLLDLAR